MRTLSPQLDLALRERVVRPVTLLELQHPKGTLRLWTGIGKLIYNGYPWTGAGTLIKASAVEDTTEIKIVQVTISLTLPDVSDEAMQLILFPATRVPLYRWLAFLDQDGAIIPDPVLRAKMYADPPKVTEDAQGSRVISLTVDSAIFNLTIPAGTMLDNEEQQDRFPGDTGLSLMATIANQTITWTLGPYNSFTPPP